MMSMNLVALICSLSLSMPITAQPMLKAGIEKDNYLNQVKVGQRLDLKRLNGIKATDVWFRCPNMMAGAWHADTSFDVESKQEKTTITDMQIGEMVDSQGNVWEKISLPNLGTVDNGPILTIQGVRDGEVRSITQATLGMEIKSVEVQVDKQSQNIVSVAESDGRSFMSLNPDGSITQYSYRDGSDKPFMQTQFQKTANFVPDMSLLPSFTAYLHSIGRDDLIPRN